jgi:hypothetical protein
MKRFFKSHYACLALVAIVVLILPVLAFAGIDDQVPTESWLFQVFQFFSTAKGKATMAIAAGVVQLLMVGFQTPLAQVAGKYRLLAVSLLSFLSVVVGALAAGLPVAGALGAAPALAAFQVFVSQVWKQFFTDKGNVVPVVGQ